MHKHAVLLGEMSLQGLIETLHQSLMNAATLTKQHIDVYKDAKIKFWRVNTFTEIALP